MSEPKELAVERHIAASPGRVWETMTKRLTEWWCPRPWTTEIRSLEWRPGGDANLTMRGPGGEESAIDGVVLDYEDGKRFVFTDAFAKGWYPKGPFMVGIFTVEADGEGTRYRAVARHWTEEALEQHRSMGFESGWGAVADQLAALAEER